MIKYWIKTNGEYKKYDNWNPISTQPQLDKGWKEITEVQFNRHKRKEKLKAKAQEGAFGLNYVNSTIRLFENVVRDKDNNGLLLSKLELIEEDLINNNQLWANDEKFLFSDKTLPWILEIKSLMTEQQKALVDINIEIVNDELPTLPIAILDVDNKYHNKLGFDPKNKDDVSPESLPHSPEPKPKNHHWTKIGELDWPFVDKIDITGYSEIKLQYDLTVPTEPTKISYSIQQPTILLDSLIVDKIYSLGIALIDSSSSYRLSHNYSTILYKIDSKDGMFKFVGETDDAIGQQMGKTEVWGK